MHRRRKEVVGGSGGFRGGRGEGGSKLNIYGYKTPVTPLPFFLGGKVPSEDPEVPFITIRFKV